MGQAVEAAALGRRRAPWGCRNVERPQMGPPRLGGSLAASSELRRARWPGAGRGRQGGHPLPLRAHPPRDGGQTSDAQGCSAPSHTQRLSGTKVGRAPVYLTEAKPKPESRRHLSAKSGDAENAQRAFWTRGRQNLQTRGVGGARPAQETAWKTLAGKGRRAEGEQVPLLISMKAAEPPPVCPAVPAGSPPQPRVRPKCFCAVAAFPHITLEGSQISKEE